MSLKYLEIMETPTASMNITLNGTFDVVDKATVNVAVDAPTAKLIITDTAEKDVLNYATAQVVDTNLIPSNIKAGVTILGVTGTAEVVIPVTDVPEEKSTNVIYNETDGRYYGWED